MHSQLFLSVSRDLAHAPCDERVNLPLISPTLHLSLSPPGRYQPTFLLCINECPPTQEGSRGFVYSCQEGSREFVYPCQFCQEGEWGLDLLPVVRECPRDAPASRDPSRRHFPSHCDVTGGLGGGSRRTGPTGLSW